MLAARLVECVHLWQRTPMQSANDGVSATAGIVVAVVPPTLRNIELSRAGPLAVGILFGLRKLAL